MEENVRKSMNEVTNIEIELCRGLTLEMGRQYLVQYNETVNVFITFALCRTFGFLLLALITKT